MTDSEKFRAMSDDELAEVQDGLGGKSRENILIEKEWRRRDRLAQHELNVKLLKWSLVGGALSGLLGVLVGWLLK